MHGPHHLEPFLVTPICFFSSLFLAFARPSCSVAEDVSFVDGLHQLPRKVVQVFNFSGWTVLTLCRGRRSNRHKWNGFSLELQHFTLKMAGTMCDEGSIGRKSIYGEDSCLIGATVLIAPIQLRATGSRIKLYILPVGPQQNCRWCRFCSKQI